MMKRYSIVIITLLVFINPLRSQMPSSTISFDERVHDFGNIHEEKGKVSHKFIFHNNGNTPAVINDIYSGCGCIGKVLSKAPVNPGSTGEVTIIFDPEYKSGFFSKEIMVYSNNGESYNRIWVKGVIIPHEHPLAENYPYYFGDGLYLRLKVMAFGYLKPAETKEMDLQYANATDEDMMLNFVVEGNSDGLRFTDPGKIGPKMQGSVTFTYTMPYVSIDDVTFRLIPYVNNKKLADTLQIKILNRYKFDLEEKARQK